MIPLRLRSTILASLLLALAAASAARAQPPTFDKSFDPATIGPGSVSTLQFDITNGSGSVVANLAFTDALPAGVTIADPASAGSGCGGTLTAPDGGTTITFTGGAVGPSSSCSITVDVIDVGLAAAVHMNASGDLTSDAGNSGPAAADLTVVTTRPGFSKSFAPATIGLGGRSTLTFTIDNTANGAFAISLFFTDNLPSGMVVADPANASTTCSFFSAPVLTAVPGTSVVSFLSGSVAASTSCTVTVDVTGAATGMLDNVSGELSSSSGGSGKASATLEVTAGTLTLQKAFTDDPVPPGATVTLELRIDNFDRISSATGITFTDDLDATLLGLASTDLPKADVCGSGSLLAESSPPTTLTLTGGNLPQEGSCTFFATLAVPGAALAGPYPNTTSPIAGDVGGTPFVGGSAGDTLFVEPGPVLTKTFLTDPVGGGDTVTVELTITNSSTTSPATDIAFTDDLGAFLSGVLVTALPAPGFCGPGAFITVLSPDLLSMAGGSLAATDSCTFTVDLLIPVGAPPGPHVNTTSDITATVDGATATGPPATDTLTIVGAPSLTKSFTDDPVLPGGTVTLELMLSHDAGAAADAVGIAFTDDLTAALSGLAATGLPIPACSGTLSGTTNLSFTGGSLMPGETCTFSVTLDVPAGALPGSYTNTTSNVMATVSGIAVTGNGAQDELLVSGLTFSKSFTDDPVIAGGTVTLELTLDNTISILDATSIQFTDDLDAALSGLTVSAPALPAPFCGGTLSEAPPGVLDFTGGSVTAGTSCSFSVTLDVPAAAADGDYVNLTSSPVAVVGGSLVVLAPAIDALSVSSELLSLTKSFTDDPVAPGGTVTLEFSLTNLDPSQTASAIAFTDDLDAALAGLASISGTQNDICGAGSMLSGTSLLTFTGGSLTAAESCTFSVTLMVPAVVAGTTATNITSSVAGMIGGLAVTGLPASDTLQVEILELTKAFDGPSVAGGTPTLTFTLRNLSATDAVSDLGFTDDLDAVLSGLVATGLPASDLCGPGSLLSGTSLLTLSGGNLMPSGTCTLVVLLQVPVAAAPGSFPNTSSDLFQFGLPVAAPATDTLSIEPPPLFSKSFAPAFIGQLLSSTLTFTIDNSGSVLAAASLAFTDNLPAGVVIAALPNVVNGCGGSLTAPPGGSSISLSVGSVAAGVTCTIDVDVTGTGLGALVNSSGDLTSSSGNSGTAGATLTVNPQPGFTKSFAPNPIVVGGTSTLTFTIDNTGSTVDAGSLAFTDNLPAGVQVAAPANAVNGCGGVLTATSGTGSITLGGGSVAAGVTCTIDVDVSSSTAAMHVNTSGALSSDLGSSGAASDTLTVDPPPGFSKSFAPNPIAEGGTSTLTFTIDNTGSTTAASALDFTDNLPAGVVVATPANASTTCTGGTLTATSGSGTITYSGGSVSAGASCTIVVDVTSSTAAVYGNTTGDLTSSLGSSGTATDSLTVDPPPGFSKSFAPNPILLLGGTSTLTFTIDNTGSTAAATGLDFTDSLPAGVVVATPSGASTTCTGGTLTATSGTGTISYSGGTVAAGTTCSVVVDVEGAAAGVHLNTTGALTSSLGSSGPASATLIVDPPVVFTKSFAPDPIPLQGGISTLTFTIDNTSSSIDATGLDFTDVLPAALVVATPSGASTTCTGGTLTAISGTGTVSYSGGTVAASATCTVDVDVAGTAAGVHLNTSGDLTSSLGNSGPASDSLTVDPAPLFSKSFAPNPIAGGGTSTLSFTIDNTASTAAASSLDFTDSLPAAVVVASPAGASTTCTGGTLTAVSGSGTIAYGGGTVTAASTCTVQVDVTTPTPGTYLNTSGDLTSSLGNSGPASDSLRVNPPPLFDKSFSPVGIAVGGTSTLTFSIDNTASTADATSLDFTDNLPAAVEVASPANASTSCTGGTLSAVPGAGTLAYSGGTVGAGLICSVQVDVTGTSVGAHLNTSGSLTSSLGSSGAASDTLTVNPAPLFGKSFAPDPIAVGQTSTLSFSIDNTASTIDATALDFTDTLPAGVVVATPANASGTCGGTLVATPGTGVIGLSGGTVSAGTTCSVQADVTSSTPALHLNTTGALTSSLGSSGTAADTLEVLAIDIAITKLFDVNPVLPGGNVVLEYTIDNTSAGGILTEISFAEDLDATLPGLIAVGLRRASDVCGLGSLFTGISLLTLSGGTLQPGESCTFQATLRVPPTAIPGTYPSTSSPVTAMLSGVPITGGTASSSLVLAPLGFTKAFGGQVPAGFSVLLSFTITNPDPTNGVSDLTFTDDLDAVLPGLAAVGLPISGVCGPGSLLDDDPVLTLTGGSLGPGASCTFDLMIDLPATAQPGSYDNVTSPLAGMVGPSSIVVDLAEGAQATLEVTDQVPVIPALSLWSLLLLAGLLSLAALWLLRPR